MAASFALCEVVWCASLWPTQLCRIWLKPRDHCSEAMRVRSEASAATVSRFMTSMMAG